MRNFIYSVVIFIFLVSGLTNANDAAKRNRMLQELDVIENIFDIHYAPTEWKKSYCSWNLQEQIHIAKQKVMDCTEISTKDFQCILKEFCRGTNDFHVDATFFSTEAAFLPFEITGCGEKYFISWLSNKPIKCNKGRNIPLEIGDELLEFDGRAIHEVVMELTKKEYGELESTIHVREAEKYLTKRMVSSGHEVPKGEIAIKVKHHQKGEEKKYVLEWNYIPEQFVNRMQIEDSSKRMPFDSPYFLRSMVSPRYEKHIKYCQNLSTIDSRQSEFVKEALGASGHKVGSLPKLGKILWQPSQSEYFEAYIFESDHGRKIAYVRIPHYRGNKEHLKEFIDLIKVFEKQSDALVIDQLDNPGGRVLYLYALASTLVQKPLQTLQEHVKLTQEDVFDAIERVEILSYFDSDFMVDIIFGDTELAKLGYPVDLKFIKGMIEESRFLIDQWNDGKIMTDLFPPHAIKMIMPHPKVQYSKPILLLINNQDFSCADLFPALLQDNKRATLFGSRTAGAGGGKKRVEYPNRFGVEEISLTCTMLQRFDGTPIENLGVMPEISYEISETDLRENYREYIEAVHRALETILPKSEEKPSSIFSFFPFFGD